MLDKNHFVAVMKVEDVFGQDFHFLGTSFREKYLTWMKSIWTDKEIEQRRYLDFTVIGFAANGKLYAYVRDKGWFLFQTADGVLVETAHLWTMMERVP